MTDWLPSERPNSRAKEPTSGGVATRDVGDTRRQRLTQAVTTRTRQASARPQNVRPTRRVVRRDIMVRRVDPWSVLKISVVFYTCMLVIGMLANAVFWAFITNLGLIDQVTEIAGALNIALRINTGNILRAFFLVGVLGVVFWSAVNVFLAFLYNLVADLIGGIRIDLAEDE